MTSGSVLTLKAFANSSAGLRFGNAGKTSFREVATLKGLRRRLLAIAVLILLNCAERMI